MSSKDSMAVHHSQLSHRWVSSNHSVNKINYGWTPQERVRQALQSSKQVANCIVWWDQGKCRWWVKISCRWTPRERGRATLQSSEHQASNCCLTEPTTVQTSVSPKTLADRDVTCVRCPNSFKICMEAYHENAHILAELGVISCMTRSTPYSGRPVGQVWLHTLFHINKIDQFFSTH